MAKTALLSAYDKTGLDEFAAELMLRGWKILASSGTAKFLNEKGLPVRDVSTIVGKPILGHRVVTLSREIHAALLATDSKEDEAELDQLGIPKIDLVYVNLYPLREEVAKPECTLESVLEKTDIGGPTILRSAAKGRRIVLYRSEDFKIALGLIREAYAGREDRVISFLAALAECEVSDYCRTSCDFLRKHAGAGSFSEIQKLLCSI